MGEEVELGIEVKIIKERKWIQTLRLGLFRRRSKCSYRLYEKYFIGEEVLNFEIKVIYEKCS